MNSKLFPNPYSHGKSKELFSEQEASWVDIGQSASQENEAGCTYRNGDNP
jgi:hypothetical protein